jgi:hypothetical protein
MRNFKSMLIEQIYNNISLDENLTNKTIKPTDKIKVGRVIADMLGVDEAESMSPEQAIALGLRKIKNKRLTPEFISVLHKMIKLAQQVGVKVDTKLLPQQMQTEALLGDTDFTPFNSFGDDPKSIYDIPKFEIGNSLIRNKNNRGLRHLKVKYKTESIDTTRAKLNLDREQQRAKHDVERARLNKLHKDREGKLASTHRQLLNQELEHEYSEFINETLSLSNSELDSLADSVNFDDLLEVLDDNDFNIIDTNTGEVINEELDINEELLTEILSRAERIKAKIRFLRTKSKRKRKLEIALKRRADTKTLNKRARKLAIIMLKKRFAKKSLDKLSVSEKERLEKIVQTRKVLIDKLALRLVPKLRKLESDRISHKAK